LVTWVWVPSLVPIKPIFGFFQNLLIRNILVGDGGYKVNHSLVTWVWVPSLVPIKPIFGFFQNLLIRNILIGDGGLAFSFKYKNEVLVCNQP
jgi:hypothetical protein